MRYDAIVQLIEAKENLYYKLVVYYFNLYTIHIIRFGSKFVNTN